MATGFSGFRKQDAGAWSWYTEWGGPIADSSAFPYNRLGTSFILNSAKNLYPCFAIAKGNISNQLVIARPYQFPANFGDTFFISGNYNYSAKGKDTSFD